MSVLLVTGGTVTPEQLAAITAGNAPRKDFLELAAATGADLVYPDLRGMLDKVSSARLVQRLFGKPLAQIYVAWCLRTQYEVIFTDSERLGLPLALLLMLSHLFTRRRPRHVMLGHLLTTPLKRRLLQFPGILHSIDTIVCHSSTQRFLLINTLGIPAEKIVLVPYQVDTEFWQPQPLGETPPQICSVGLEFRDYPTLIEAVRDSDITTTIAAASYWSQHNPDVSTLPPNVHLTGLLQYPALRDLYRQSRFVVVPLLDVPNQAGITTILEAMAMGKAVIVSHTAGQQDIVKDRRRQPRFKASLTPHSSLLEKLGLAPEFLHQHTGMYVEPGNTLALKKATAYLVEHPEEADVMGQHGRQLVETTMDVQHFAQRIAALLQAKARKEYAVACAD